MRQGLRRRVRGCGAVALVIGACGYDFDEYVADEPTAAGGASTTASGGSDVGEAGAPATPSGGTTGGTAASAGAAGAADSGGEGGAPPSGAGGEGGAEAGAASITGGSTDGGTTHGGSAAGGASAAGGSTATAGAGGTGGVDCAELGGAVFDGHCYFYVSSLLDFASARSACNDAAATLVAINSEEEQRFLESTFFAPANDAWIGLSLAELTNPNSTTCKASQSSCPFHWETDEPLSYTKWGSHSASDREPNYTGACVRIQAATLDWADQGCSERVRAICEAE